MKEPQLEPKLEESEEIKKRDQLIGEVASLIVQLGAMGEEVFNAIEKIKKENTEAEEDVLNSKIEEQHKKFSKKASDLVKKIQGHLRKIEAIENADKHNIWEREDLELLEAIIAIKIQISTAAFPEILQGFNALKGCFAGELAGEYNNILENFEKVYLRRAEYIIGHLRDFINSIENEAIRNKLLKTLNDADATLTEKLEKFTQKNKDQDFNIYYQKFLHEVFKKGAFRLITWFNESSPEDLTFPDHKAFALYFYNNLKRDIQLIDDEREKALIIILMRVLKTVNNCEYNNDDLDVLKAVVNSSYALFLNYDENGLEGYENALRRVEQKAKEYKNSAFWRGILEAMIVFLGLAVLIAALAGAIILFSLSLPLSATATFILLGVQLTALGLKIAAGAALVTGGLLTGVSFFGAGIFSKHSKHFDEKYNDFNELMKVMQNSQKFSLEALEQKSEPLFAEVIDKLNAVYGLNEDNITDDSKLKVIGLYTALDAYAQNMQEITQIRLAKEKGVVLSSISDERIKAELPKYIANDINENNRLKDIEPDQFEFILLISETAYKLVDEFNSKIRNEIKRIQDENLSDEQLQEEYLGHTELMNDLDDDAKKFANILFKTFAPSISSITQALDNKFNEITALYNEMCDEGVLIPPYSEDQFCVEMAGIMMKADQLPMQKFSELKEFINESLENNLIPKGNYFVQKIVEIVQTPLAGEKELGKMSIVLSEIGGGEDLNNFQNVKNLKV